MVDETETQEQVYLLSDALRQQGYIDVERSDNVEIWAEEVALRVIKTMRELGWTVTPPKEE